MGSVVESDAGVLDSSKKRSLPDQDSGPEPKRLKTSHGDQQSPSEDVVSKVQLVTPDLDSKESKQAHFEVCLDVDGRILNKEAFVSAMSAAELFETVMVKEQARAEIIEVPYLVIKSVALRDQLRPHWNIQSLYDKLPRIRHSSLFDRIPEIQIAAATNDAIRALSLFLVDFNIDNIVKVRDMLRDGVISDEFVPFYFEKGKQFFVNDVCMTCLSTRKDSYGNWVLNGNIFAVDSEGKMSQITKSYSMPGIGGTAKLVDLPIRVPTAAEIERLSQRGRVYMAKTRAPFLYQMHEGMTLRDSRYKLHNKGRVVVSAIDYARENPNLYLYGVDAGKQVDSFDEKKYGHQLEAVVYGCILSSKTWVEMKVLDLQDICFAKDAFGKVVMDEAKKKVLMDCITHKPSQTSDMIKGKGAGMMILLSGPPGVGKTLLAEATAERLQVPLYAITSGQLGSNQATIETRLKTALGLVSSWGAVMLIDEADVFLQARDNTNIERNAIVCTFLQSLEYHNSIVFLTTNRVSDFDEAMYSRLPMHIRYVDMDRDTRMGTWKNLAPEFFAREETKQDTKVVVVDSDKELDALFDIALNGREIRNMIHLGKSLAAAAKESFVIDHVFRIMRTGMTGKTIADLPFGERKE
jgi:hypothetical protein